MSAKVVGYHVQGKNSTTCMTRIDQPKKLRKKLEQTAEKNTLNGTSPKNKTFPKGI